MPISRINYFFCLNLTQVKFFLLSLGYGWPINTKQKESQHESASSNRRSAD